MMPDSAPLPIKCDYGWPANGLYLAMAGCPGRKITNCLLAPSANELGEPQEDKAASGVAPVLTPALRIFCRTVVLVQQRSATR